QLHPVPSHSACQHNLLLQSHGRRHALALGSPRSPRLSSLPTRRSSDRPPGKILPLHHDPAVERVAPELAGPGKIIGRAARHPQRDRKSTRLNSSHVSISYAVFCLKKTNVLQPTVPASMSSQSGRLSTTL